MKAALPLALCAAALSACVPAATAPAPAAPAPVARPAPVRAPPPSPVVQAPAQDSWMDAPASAGDWRYTAQGARSEATFWGSDNQPKARLRCIPESNIVILSLPASGAAQPLVTIRSETMTRAQVASVQGREQEVSFSGDDPLLDAIAISKGRFAVEATGLPPLFLPSWAEVSRVIENCR